MITGSLGPSHGNPVTLHLDSVPAPEGPGQADGVVTVPPGDKAFTI